MSSFNQQSTDSIRKRKNRLCPFFYSSSASYSSDIIIELTSSEREEPRANNVMQHIPDEHLFVVEINFSVNQE